jgi:MFS family permease
MRTRWRILACLFAARMSMAYQFAAVGAVAPLFETGFGVGTTELGLLIGLYFLPGVLIAMPGGALGARIGAKRAVVAGLGLMLAGGVVMAASAGWTPQLVGRVIAGVGGVLLNVMMTKMVADWFAERELSTAMALFVNSWPAGIAVALLTVPIIAETGGLSASLWVVAAFTGLGLALVAAIYTDPAGAAAPSSAQSMPRGSALVAIVLAGTAWGLFNAALGMVFGFGPANLVERGYPLTEASALVSIVLWAIIAAGIFGGILADATGRPFTILTVGNVVMFGSILMFPTTGSPLLMLIAIGFATGLPSGIYMAFAARSLAPKTRALGMGLFFTLYYVIFAGAPWLGGALIDRFGGTGVTFTFGAILVVLAFLASLSHQMMLREPGKPKP